MHMQYFYHHVPEDFKGTTLLPLNVLKFKYPEIYQKESLKYDGREHITQQRIPLLDNSLWNDVIFMTAVHPQKIFEARSDAGWGKIRPQRYFKIDPSKLDQERLAVYLFKPRSSNNKSGFEIDNFAKYSYADVSEYAVVPQSTKDYFKYEHESGQNRIRLFYRYIPHILYKGEIDISDVEIITIS